jgi:hypothetical protein
MSKFSDLRDKFDKDVEELQYHCQHQPSDWMRYEWAPGHSMGQVIVCLECNKIIESRSWGDVPPPPSPLQEDDPGILLKDAGKKANTKPREEVPAPYSYKRFLP